MGIKGLPGWLKQNASHIFHSIPISTLSGKRVAIDASIYLYKFVSTENKFAGKWVDLYTRFILWFRRNNIRPLVVFDGVAPELKGGTREKRREVFSSYKDAATALKNAIDSIDSQVDQVETDLIDSISKLLKLSDGDLDNCSKDQIRDLVFQEYRNMNSRNIVITSEHTDTLKEILDSLGLPWVQAPNEAEKHCAWLCKHGYVSGVVTTDSDIHVYGTSLVLTGIKYGQQDCTAILNENILEATSLTHDQFVDMCILCGTDYNENIKGIGPAGAYRLIKKYSTLENMAVEIDTTCLNYTEIRKLFTLPENDLEYSIPRIKQKNLERLEKILTKCGSDVTIEEVEMLEYQPKFMMDL